MVAKAPIAADSVGVAQPADMEITTMVKIDTSGSTYFRNGTKRAQPWYSASGEGGASSGESMTRPMMYATKATERIRPGTTPPTSSCEIEMPEKLPSSTVSAEGGISMSTAPIAITGPVAMVG